MDAVQQLTDRQEIADLLAAYGGWLDGRGDPIAIFAPDVVAHGPAGAIHGLDDLVALVARGGAGGDRTQHFHTDVLVALDGDTAVVTANQLVQFFHPGRPPHRTSGLLTECRVARRPAGWRITTVTVTLEWIVGDMPT